MTANELLTELTRIFFVLIAILTLVDFLPHRDKTRRDIFLMSASIAIPVLLPRIVALLGLQTPWVNTIGTVALAAQPYLLIRLVRYFRAVPVVIREGALLGMIGSWAVILVFSPALPTLATLLIIAYFAIIDGYAIVAFVRGAFSSSGVTRNRLRFAAAGSGFLVLVLLIAGVRTIVPPLTPYVLPITQSGAILCAFAYYLCFAPPRWLTQAWQHAELRHYLLQSSSNQPSTEVLERLQLAVTQAMGASMVAVVFWDDDSGHLRLQNTAESARLSDIDWNAAETIQRVWRDQRSTAIHKSAGLSSGDTRLMQAANAETLLIIPIATSERASGLLLVFLKYNSLFLDDDLHLLTIFAQQTAIFLENNAMLEESHRHAEDLEQKVQERTAALQASEAELRALFAAMNDAIAVLDSQGKYLKIAPTNPTPSSKWSDDLLGKTLNDVFPAGQAESFLASIREALETQQTTNMEYNLTMNGSNSWFAATVSPIRDNAVLWVAHDITERKQTEEILARFTRDLQRSNEELQQFAYVASHDLQEPLRMISSYLQLIENRYADKLDDEGHEFIDYAVKGAARMKDLINDLLAFSRVETQLKNFALMDVQKAVDEACNLLKMSIDESGATITHDPLPQIRADEQLIIQLFQNLIGNAIKYRSERKPEIHVGAIREGGQWVFSVRDNGIGIDAKYLGRIFVIFQRLHNREKYPGTGIGLAICKKVVQRHGGRIWVESELGKGTTFYFSIPA
jgi:PAS domain S-box-containing protein